MKIDQKKFIYYVGFPAFTFFLCIFSYQLGLRRGIDQAKKDHISKVLEEFAQGEEESKLTYYGELHEEKNPIVEQVQEEQKKIEKAPVVVEKPKTAPTSNSESAIQVGAFTDMGKADELTDRLKNSGFEAFTRPVQSKGVELYRVLVKSTKEEVASIQSKLATQGYKNTFVVAR